MHLQRVKLLRLMVKGRCIYQKIYYLTFALDLFVMVTDNVDQYPLHQETCAILQSLRLLRPTVKEVMHLQVKHTILPLTLTLGSHKMLLSTLYI